MKTVGLWGLRATEQERLLTLLPAHLRERLRLAGLPAAVHLMAVEEFSLLAVAPTAQTDVAVALPPCRLLLLPGTEHGLLRRCVAPCAISYGVSHKDSLTLSSVEEDSISLAIMRELPTIWGGIVERQELQLSSVGGQEALGLLFRVGLLLVLGIPPEDLPAFLAAWC